MLCPVCDDKLREIEKYGVMVDICPSCKGVWLDRGELEKVLSLEQAGSSEGDRRDGKEHGESKDHERRDGEYSARNKPAKKRSFLSDLMEGFGD
jgi:uncharacterized protein